jgi:hypothetical protein
MSQCQPRLRHCNDGQLNLNHNTMKYLIYSTDTEKYYHSDTLPTNTSDCDVVDLEAKKCISGPSEEHDIVAFPEPEKEAETQEIPVKEEREFDPEEKHDVAPDVENGDEG